MTTVTRFHRILKRQRCLIYKELEKSLKIGGRLVKEKNSKMIEN